MKISPKTGIIFKKSMLDDVVNFFLAWELFTFMYVIHRRSNVPC